MGVRVGFPTIGYHHDDFVDNVINSKLIERDTNISMIFNGYIWQKEQFEEIVKHNFYGVRVYNLRFLV